MKKVSNWPFTVAATTQLTFDNSSSLRGRAYAHNKKQCNPAPQVSGDLLADLSVLGSKPARAGFDGSAASCPIVFQGVSA